MARERRRVGSNCRPRSEERAWVSTAQTKQTGRVERLAVERLASLWSKSLLLANVLELPLLEGLLERREVPLPSARALSHVAVNCVGGTVGVVGGDRDR